MLKISLLIWVGSTDINSRTLMSGDWSGDGVSVLGLIFDTGCVASSKIGLPCQAGPREIVLLEHSTTKYALLDLRRVRDDRGKAPKADVRHNDSGSYLQMGRNGRKSKSRCSLSTTISIRWFMQVQMLDFLETFGCDCQGMACKWTRPSIPRAYWLIS